MTLRLIRYRTKPDATERNRALIENVFKELQAKSPEGVRYMVLAFADGSFAHLVETGDGDNPLLQLDAFKAFQSGAKDRHLEPAQVGEAVIVGNYRMLGDR